MIKRLFYPAIAMLAICSTFFTSCRGKDDEVVANTITIYQNATKSTVEDKDGALVTTWGYNDGLSVSNLTKSVIQKKYLHANESTENTSFTGDVFCDEGDVLALIFPSVAIDTITGVKGGIVSTDISGQDGSLETIGKKMWLRYAKATVTSVDAAKHTAEGKINGSFINLLGVAKISFSIDGKKASNISRVCLSDLPTTLEFNIDQDPSSFSFDDAEYKGFIDIKECESDEVYVALFPGKTSSDFFVTVDGQPYEGKATFTITNGKILPLNVDLKPVSTSDYIEIGSVKWAPSNFAYLKSWMFHQKGSDYIKGSDESYTNMDCFNWGVSSTNALHYGSTGEYIFKCGNKTYIQGVMFTDATSVNRTTDYMQALYGDVVYWATKGKYRLPSSSEVYCIAPLSSEPITKIDGIISEFTTVDGVKGMKITDQNNGNSIFLPAGGYRDTYGNRFLEGEIGRYMTGNSVSASIASYLCFDKNGLVITDSNLGEISHMGFKGYGANIRPVLAL